MRFTKMHGIGNDYVYVNTMEEKVENPEDVARFVSDRHKGIGSDGLILIGKNQDGIFTMDIYNADGSRGKMCGNGMRCTAKYLYDRGYVKTKDFDVATLAGLVHVSLMVSGGVCNAVSVDLGEPEFEEKKIPFLPEFAENGKIKALDREFEFTAVSTGTPHCVIFLEQDVDGFELEKYGPVLENHPAFPDRVNVEFVNVIGRKAVKMRVWERGSGETLACGTGASAVAVAAIKCGYCDKGEVLVHLKGGDLKIFWFGKSVFMSGSATEVFRGEIVL